MKIGFKYCGGCNPNYERNSILKRARQDYPNAIFLPYDSDDRFDLVLVICGCLAECFSFSCPNSVHGALYIRSPDEYSRLTAFMQASKQNHI